jgi:hypothetical protein
MMTAGKNVSRKLLIRILLLIVIAGMSLLSVKVLLRRGGRLRSGELPFGTNMKGIANGLVAYTHDYDGRLPPGDKWCDILIQLEYVPPQQFVCAQSDSVVGESDAAINKNVAGKRINEFPADVVLLFETSFGRNQTGRKGLLNNRAYCQTLPCDNGDRKVYEHRWNQAGGPEILTTSYHDDKGCWVAFCDTRVAFVKTSEVSRLKWR